MRSIRLFAVGAVALIALTGCAATVAPKPTVSAASKTPTPTPTPMEAAPLTGVDVPEGSVAHSVFMAKIDNHPDARPQYGLNHTDIVFEELVEGGMTRYVAVWHSDIPDSIGPVRSIRPMDPDIASPFQGIIAYSGGQTPFVNMMRQTQVLNFIHGQSDTEAYMSRTTEKESPHNVVVKAKQAVADHAELVAPGKAFTFATGGEMATAVQFGAMTDALHMQFSSGNTPSWVWDPADGVYKRKQDNGNWDVDETGAVITADNIIVQITPESTLFGNVKFVPKAEVVGSGQGYISTGGKTFPVTWSKSDRNAFTVYTWQGANVAKLAPGNTWVELVPTKGKFWTDAHQG